LNEQNSWFGDEGVESMYLTSNAFIQFHSQDLEEITQEDRKFAENHPFGSTLEYGGEELNI
jgi:hypothetical protein